MLVDGGQEKREREERRECKGVGAGSGVGGLTIELSTHTRPPLVTCVGLGRKKGEDARTHVREHTHMHTQRTKQQLF